MDVDDMHNKFEKRLSGLYDLTTEILIQYYDVCTQLEIEKQKNQVLEQQI